MPAPKRNAADKFLTGKQFQVWRISRDLTYDDIAEWLGVHPNSVMNYAKVGLTRTQALALAAIERGLSPWQPTREDWARTGLIPDANEYPPSENKPTDATLPDDPREATDGGDDEVPSDNQREGSADAPCHRSAPQRA